MPHFAGRDVLIHRRGEGGGRPTHRRLGPGFRDPTIPHSHGGGGGGLLGDSPAVGHRCVCMAGTVRHKAEVQSKSQRETLFSDVSRAPFAAKRNRHPESQGLTPTPTARPKGQKLGTQMFRAPLFNPFNISPPRSSHNPPCDIPSRCCSFTGPRTVTRSPLRMLRRVAAFCRPLRPVLLLVSFPRSRSPVVGVLGLCWLWRDVPFARQRRPIIGVLGDVFWAAGDTPHLMPVEPRPLGLPIPPRPPRGVGPALRTSLLAGLMV